MFEGNSQVADNRHSLACNRNGDKCQARITDTVT